MQDIIIKNVKTAEYKDVDTNPDSDVIIYPDSGNIRFMAGGKAKSLKLDSEVNYLDGE